MSRPKVLLLAFVVLASTAGAAQAGGAYSQNFSTAVSDWAVANDTWAVTAGDYRNQYHNQTAVLPAPISWYTGNTWTTNFKYKVRAYSEWPGTSNKVGLIFGVNSTGTQYFQVLVNMSGRSRSSTFPAPRCRRQLEVRVSRRPASASHLTPGSISRCSSTRARRIRRRAT
jgi:hypothetical protein